VHHFSYALFPHAGDLRNAGVVAEAEAFNVPLQVIAVESGPGSTSARSSIVSVDQPNVTVEAVKMADREDAVVIRLCEVWGARGPARVTFDRPVHTAVRTDVLEREVGPATVVNGGIALDLRPFELVTLKLTFAS
jgi:alpha-mannosidase